METCQGWIMFWETMKSDVKQTWHSENPGLADVVDCEPCHVCIISNLQSLRPCLQSCLEGLNLIPAMHRTNGQAFLWSQWRQSSLSLKGLLFIFCQNVGPFLCLQNGLPPNSDGFSCGFPHKNHKIWGSHRADMNRYDTSSPYFFNIFLWLNQLYKSPTLLAKSPSFDGKIQRVQQPCRAPHQLCQLGSQ